MKRQLADIVRIATAALWVVLCAARVHAATVDQVRAQVERCYQRLERIEERYREVNRLVEAAMSTEHDRASAFEPRVLQMRGRVDGAWGRYMEVQEELARAEGACSECLLNKADMFCRTVESLESDVQDMRDDAAGLRPMAGSQATPGPDSSTAKPDSTAPHPSAHKWRVTIGADYTLVGQLTHVDTTRQSVSDSLVALRDDPYSAYARARYDYSPKTGALKQLSPSVYVSNQRADATIASDFRFARECVWLSAEGTLSKRLARDTGSGGDLAWVGSDSDTLDGGWGGLEMRLTNAATARPLTYAVPLGADIRMYRHEKRGYSSYLSWQSTPWARLTSGDSRREAGIDGRVEYRDYFIPDPNDSVRDSADALSVSVGAEGRSALWRDASGSMRLEYRQDRHLQRHRPWRAQTLLGELSASAKACSRITTGIRASLEHIRENHTGTWTSTVADSVFMPFLGIWQHTTRVDTLSSTHVLDGTVWRVRPSVQATLGPAVRVTVQAQWRGGAYGLVDSIDGSALDAAQYIDRSYQRLEPGAELTIDHRWLHSRTAGTYLTEWVEHAAQDSLSSRGVRLEADITLSLTRVASLSVSGEYEWRRTFDRATEYRNGTVAGRVSLAW